MAYKALKISNKLLQKSRTWQKNRSTGFQIFKGLLSYHLFHTINTSSARNDEAKTL